MLALMRISCWCYHALQRIHATLLLVLCCVVSLLTGCLRFSHSVYTDYVAPTMQYQDAVEDSLTIEDYEIQPLVSLKQGEPFVTYDASGRVLLLTVHSVPQVFVPHESAPLQLSTWTFTDKEFMAWLRDHGMSIPLYDWPLRFNQLLGMPMSRQSTHVSALWVHPDDIIRPAYTTDIYSSKMGRSFDDTYANHDPRYQEWFNGNIIASYFSGDSYPWTRIGYTYDWGNAHGEYGLSEFLVIKGAEVEVAYTLSIADFIEQMKAKVVAHTAPYQRRLHALPYQGPAIHVSSESVFATRTAVVPEAVKGTQAD